METTAEYQCSYCGEYEQSYVEDCQVCCRPNTLNVMVDRDSLDVEISTEYRG
jgi:Cysteine-rich CPXCG